MSCEHTHRHKHTHTLLCSVREWLSELASNCKDPLLAGSWLASRDLSTTQFTLSLSTPSDSQLLRYIAAKWLHVSILIYTHIQCTCMTKWLWEKGHNFWSKNKYSVMKIQFSKPQIFTTVGAQWLLHWLWTNLLSKSSMQVSMFTTWTRTLSWVP